MICTNCNKEIGDDNVKYCPYCGVDVGARFEQSFQQQSQQPIQFQNQQPVGKKSFFTTPAGIVTIVLSSIAVLVLAYLAVFFYQSYKFNENYNKAYRAMVDSAIVAEHAGDLIHDVWYNTVFEKKDSKTDKYTRSGYAFNSDFDTSLKRLFNDEDFSKKIEEIKTSQIEVKEYMSKLSDPPRRFQEEYDALKKAYDSYMEFTNLVVSPTGSLYTYTERYVNSKSELITGFDMVSGYLQEETTKASLETSEPSSSENFEMTAIENARQVVKDKEGRETQDSDEYFLYDLDGDGDRDMIVSHGNSNADWSNDVFENKSGKLYNIGSVPELNRWFEGDSKKGVYAVAERMGNCRVRSVYIKDGKLFQDVVYESSNMAQPYNTGTREIELLTVNSNPPVDGY